MPSHANMQSGPTFGGDVIARCLMPDILAFYESEEGQREFAEWKKGQEVEEQENDRRGGRTVQTAAPALFAFMGSVSYSVDLSASRSASAPPRFGSGCFRIGQRKPIIRTRPLSETDSDYMDLVRETGLEPVRQRHTHLKRACLPVPALAQNKVF